MSLEGYVDIGFDGRPREQQLDEISGIINKTLKTLRVKNYELRREVTGWYYYSFNLEIAERSKIDSELMLRVCLPDLAEKLKSTYDNVRHVGYGEGEIGILKAIA